jgi:hypothetical protein
MEFNTQDALIVIGKAYYERCMLERALLDAAQENAALRQHIADLTSPPGSDEREGGDRTESAEEADAAQTKPKTGA